MTVHVLEHYVFDVPEDILAIEDENRRKEAIEDAYHNGEVRRSFERSYLLREEPTVETTMHFIKL
jgi:hypothetical protein